MPDRKKIISTFEKIISVCKEDGCDFVDLSFEDAEQILALLKEQEPKQVIGVVEIAEGMKVGRCPSCDRSFVSLNIDEVKFCKSCGQAVKWE